MSCLVIELCGRFNCFILPFVPLHRPAIGSQSKGPTARPVSCRHCHFTSDSVIAPFVNLVLFISQKPCGTRPVTSGTSAVTEVTVKESVSRVFRCKSPLWQ